MNEKSIPSAHHQPEGGERRTEGLHTDCSTLADAVERVLYRLIWNPEEGQKGAGPERGYYYVDDLADPQEVKAEVLALHAALTRFRRALAEGRQGTP